MAKYYVICDDDCRYEGLTKEQILAAIEQALEQGYVSDPDAAVFSKIREIGAGNAIQLWVGTETEFNAISPAPDVGMAFVRVSADGVVYLCSDDESAEAFNNHMGNTNNPHNVTLEQVIGDNVTGADYSKGETKTGDRWIDGKDIYAKILCAEDMQKGVSVNLNISDDMEFAWVDTSASFFHNRSTDGCYLITGHTSTSDDGVLIFVSQGYKYVTILQNLMNNLDAYIKVCYTKINGNITDA